jgi:hypothetical protein
MVWTPPAPTATMPGVFPDAFTVRIYSSEGGPTLVGAIELISPGNKDRDESRQAFAIKCANYLHQQVGLIIVDIVLQLLGQPAEYCLAKDVNLYAVAYRPVRSANLGACPDFRMLGVR